MEDAAHNFLIPVRSRFHQSEVRIHYDLFRRCNPPGPSIPLINKNHSRSRALKREREEEGEWLGDIISRGAVASVQHCTCSLSLSKIVAGTYPEAIPCFFLSELVFLVFLPEKFGHCAARLPKLPAIVLLLRGFTATISGPAIEKQMWEYGSPRMESKTRYETQRMDCGGGSWQVGSGPNHGNSKYQKLHLLPCPPKQPPGSYPPGTSSFSFGAFKQKIKRQSWALF
ncbi:hypothetical protein H6P81_002033 [Aristolochia fimbriata]|uniref:Uncharacterized protein n=1 Tax=Aristolochia fimbriata TaxID=158543 RepID=A0AAV7FBD9_ARIFI|nr:hypothetical protein H6P81_002033 [Aristolochia fimbriata]